MNEQERFWSGSSGDEYVARNAGAAYLAAYTALFARALTHAHDLSSCIEFGAGTGMALRALKTLYPDQDQHAVEINGRAADELAKHIPPENIARQSMLSFEPGRTFDLVLIKTLLIAIHPAELPKAYKALHAAAGKYVLVAEYYNPVPVEITYRGHTGMLWKRDFAGEMLDAYPDLNLIDYGFIYGRDRRLEYAGRDVNWFLLAKQ